MSSKRKVDFDQKNVAGDEIKTQKEFDIFFHEDFITSMKFYLKQEEGLSELKGIIFSNNNGVVRKYGSITGFSVQEVDLRTHKIISMNVSYGKLIKRIEFSLKNNEGKIIKKEIGKKYKENEVSVELKPDDSQSIVGLTGSSFGEDLNGINTFGLILEGNLN